MACLICGPRCLNPTNHANVQQEAVLLTPARIRAAQVEHVINVIEQQLVANHQPEAVHRFPLDPDIWNPAPKSDAEAALRMVLEVMQGAGWTVTVDTSPDAQGHGRVAVYVSELPDHGHNDPPVVTPGVGWTPDKMDLADAGERAMAGMPDHLTDEEREHWIDNYGHGDAYLTRDEARGLLKTISEAKQIEALRPRYRELLQEAWVLAEGLHLRRGFETDHPIMVEFGQRILRLKGQLRAIGVVP